MYSDSGYDPCSCSFDTVETFSYDGLSRRLTAEKEIDANSVSETEFSYNSFSLVTQADETILDASEVQISYDYDQAGNLTEITYPDGNSVEIEREPLGRIDSIDIDGTAEVEYQYVGSRVAESPRFLINSNCYLEFN